MDHIQANVKAFKLAVHNYITSQSINTSNISASIQEYCTPGSFRGQCHPDEVVTMQHAIYGRMALGKCLKTDFGHLGCKAGIFVKYVLIALQLQPMNTA